MIHGLIETGSWLRGRYASRIRRARQKQAESGETSSIKQDKYRIIGYDAEGESLYYTIDRSAG